MDKKLFITTAVDYVNAEPHLGHALEKIQADTIARYYRTLNYKVHFLSGSDENSLKNVQAAEKNGVDVKDWVKKYSQSFYRLKDALNLSYDDFIRTTENRHIKGAQKLWQACEHDIYKKKYTGLYCVGCEAFYKEEELEDGLCPEHKIKLELVTEENYFFKLSKYQDKIIEVIENDTLKITPISRRNEALSFLKSGLEDICISRSSERAKGWGIPVPGDDSQVIWVWFDALSNYINALGYGEDSDKFKEWWTDNDNIIHVIGKGISRFHAIYWPGMLMSAGLRLPTNIFVHGYITVGGGKMSKSQGITINPADMAQKYGIDPFRYYLLREIPAYEDGDFSEERLKDRYNRELASGLGNLLSRVTALAYQYSKPIKIEADDLKEKIDLVWNKYHKSMSEYRFHEVLGEIWSLISLSDEYISNFKPWEKIKDDKAFVKNISSLILCLGNIALMIKPFLPQTSDKILESLKLNNISLDQWSGLDLSLEKSESLFPRLN